MTMNELLPQATAQRNFTDIMLSEQARQRWVKYYMIWLLHTSKIYKLIYHTGHQFVMGVGIISEMLVILCFFWPGSGCTCRCIFYSATSLSVTSAGSDSNWTQNADRFPCQEVSPLQWLLSAMLDLLHLCRVWVSKFGGDGPGWAQGQ